MKSLLYVPQRIPACWLRNSGKTPIDWLICSYTVPAIRLDSYAGMAQLWHQLPNCVYLSKHTSLHHTRVTSNLLHWGVLASIYAYIYPSTEVLCLWLWYKALTRRPTCPPVSAVPRYFVFGVTVPRHRRPTLPQEVVFQQIPRLLLARSPC